MPPVKTVEISRPVRGMNRHAGEPRLLQIEDLCRSEAIPERGGVHVHDYRSASGGGLAPAAYQTTRAEYCVFSGSGVTAADGEMAVLLVAAHQPNDAR
jgi:hypothetical protein